MYRVKVLMAFYEMDMKELAEKTGCSYKQLLHVINEGRKPSVELIVKLCEVFDVTPDFILGYGEARFVDKGPDMRYTLIGNTRTSYTGR